MTEEMNSAVGQTGEELNELMQARRDKLAAIVEKGIEPFGRHYEPTHHAQQVSDQFADLEGKPVRPPVVLWLFAGMAKRGFANLRDMSGQIQLYLRQDILGEAAYDVWFINSI